VILLLAFVLQVYALASLWGKGEYLENVGSFAGTFPSPSFGMRQLTVSIAILVPGLARLLELAGRTSLRLLASASFSWRLET
jgi:hypothetical protein